MRFTGLLILILLLTGITGWPQTSQPSSVDNTISIYNFPADTIDGKTIKLKTYKGKVLLIVNTASQCGYTPQYKPLTELYGKYKDKGLEILGFPANDFGKQEPGGNDEIKQFCSVKFAVQFPMFSKISVVGKEQHPLFQYLTSQDNPDFKGDIKWNFEKFLIGRDGKLLHRYRSNITPLSEELVKAVETALAGKS